MTMTFAQPKEAATVVLCRDGVDGPEVFMVRRHKENKFMANAHVFVGGKVDAEDFDPRWEAYSDVIDGAAVVAQLAAADVLHARAILVAAIRETFEEAGILLATRSNQNGFSSSELQGWRDALNRQQDDQHVTFIDLAQREGLRLQTSALVYLTRWITPEQEPRRFDARFFVVRAPDDQHASYDPRETSEGHWMTIQQILKRQRAAEMDLAPPTLCTLEDLAQCSSNVEALLRATVQAAHAPICPRLNPHASSELMLLLPGDYRYDDPQGAHRTTPGSQHYCVHRDGRWQHVRQ